MPEYKFDYIRIMDIFVFGPEIFLHQSTSLHCMQLFNGLILICQKNLYLCFFPEKNIFFSHVSSVKDNNNFRNAEILRI